MATFTVTNANDSGAGSLRAAVLAANAALGAHTIGFAASFDGGAEDLIRLTSGEVEITDALSIVGGPAGVTITGDKNGDDVTVAGGITDVAASLDGEDRLDDNSRIFHETSGAAVSLGGLTLTGGRNTADGLSGGGVLGAGSIALTDCTVIGNSTRGAKAGGGGISATDVFLTNSKIINNQTASGESYYGGGGGGGIKGLTVVVSDSLISGNSTNGFFAGGGGILGGSVSLTDSVVSQNSANSYNGGGGGVRANLVEVTRSTISSNYASGELANGGGIRGGTVTLVESIVDGNYTNGYRTEGGGIDGGEVYVTDSTISNNKLGKGDGGGGISGGLIRVLNSTLYGNSVYSSGYEGVGSGIYGRDIHLYNSSITKNIGAGIESHDGFQEINLVNSIISGNLNDIVNSHYGSFTNVSSIVGGDGRSIFAATTEIAPGVFAGVLADNGGPTKTVALKLDPSNPAIGGADPATATATDQRGVARDADPDIGAFEAGPLGGLTIVGGPKADALTGTVLADRIFGRGGDDTLRGLLGDDLLKGEQGCDLLRGDGGRDELFGGAGGDRLVGGTGFDALWGGCGADVFLFGPKFGSDRIGDFDANPGGGQDKIDLRALGVTATNFDEQVTITDVGASTRIKILHSGTILCVGVGGDGANAIDQGDFLV